MVLGCLMPVGHSNMQLVAWSEGVGLGLFIGIREKKYGQILIFQKI
jgi:hypothetical protein